MRKVKFLGVSIFVVVSLFISYNQAEAGKKSSSFKVCQTEDETLIVRKKCKGRAGETELDLESLIGEDGEDGSDGENGATNAVIRTVEQVSNATQLNLSSPCNEGEVAVGGGFATYGGTTAFAALSEPLSEGSTPEVGDEFVPDEWRVFFRNPDSQNITFKVYTICVSP
ncbi:MAG: hypothetical protein KDD56_06025 [Bdellovibrionales bacterium]|nr:hypothetical protein [Bdellovibrionales bacterium]